MAQRREGNERRKWEEREWRSGRRAECEGEEEEEEEEEEKK